VKTQNAKPRRRKSPQLELLKKEKLAFGGDGFTTREGRRGHRPLVTRESMHLVLRSSRAKRDWSFKKADNEKAIREILKKFSLKYGVRILSAANVGNHIHIHLKLSNRHTYRPFIRAITSAIAMAVTGINKWTKIGNKRLKFWDRRPYTRVVQGFRAFLNLRDYIRINTLEGYGIKREHARFIVRSGVWVNTA
jgi:REP element-mobilizing transposase RayT